jgi:hypothetical protein
VARNISPLSDAQSRTEINGQCSPQASFPNYEQLTAFKLVRTTWQLSEKCQDGIASTCYRQEEGDEEPHLIHNVRTTESAEKEIERLFTAGQSELDVVVAAVDGMEESDVAKECRYIVEARATSKGVA